MTRVLIVDDNKALTTLMKEILEVEGAYQVETAENGEEGYLAFLNFRPDIILTDVDMPVMNGIEMVRAIRTHHNSNVKTIYMSGEMDSYRRLLQSEKTEYNANLLYKPFSLTKMVSLFEKCCK